MTVLGAHDVWAWVVVLANGLVGCWALAAHRWRVLGGRRLWAAVIVAQATVFVQVVLGVWLTAVDGRTAPGLHNLYGFVALFTVGMLYAYRSQLVAHVYILYGLGELFMMGLAIRAMFLGAGI